MSGVNPGKHKIDVYCEGHLRVPRMNRGMMHWWGQWAPFTRDIGWVLAGRHIMPCSHSVAICLRLPLWGQLRAQERTLQKPSSGLNPTLLVKKSPGSFSHLVTFTTYLNSCLHHRPSGVGLRGHPEPRGKTSKDPGV